MQGVIKYINKREWQGDEGLINLYSFKLDGDNTQYRTGTSPVPFPEGTAVEFDLSGRGKNNVDMKSLRTISKEEMPASVAQAVSSAGSRDISIAYQSARKAAVEFVASLVEQELLPLPTKKADKADAVYKYVDHYTGEFFDRHQEFLAS